MKLSRDRGGGGSGRGDDAACRCAASDGRCATRERQRRSRAAHDDAAAIATTMPATTATGDVNHTNDNHVFAVADEDAEHLVAVPI